MRIVPICLLPAALFGTLDAQDRPSPETTVLAPGISLVTALSTDRPFLGQQISVVYTLRNAVAVSAIDIEPQHFTGFWSYVIPVEEPVLSSGDRSGGQLVRSLLLKQVVLYPLESGRQVLPPLKLKLRFGTGPASEDWDMIGSSLPLAVAVRPIPARQSDTDETPLVGDLSGSLSQGRAGDPSAQLELHGTANLAFFNPERWLDQAGFPAVSARLQNPDETPRRRITAEGVELSLVQHRRWVLHGSSLGRLASRATGLSLPVFEPTRGAWRSLALSGEGSAEPTRIEAYPPRLATEAPAPRGERPYERLPRYALPSVLLLGVLLMVAAALARRLRSRSSAIESPAELEAQWSRSPRAFVDSAYRMLKKHYESGSDTGNADTEAIRGCLDRLQSLRFIPGPVPEAIRHEVVNLIESLSRRGPPRKGLHRN